MPWIPADPANLCTGDRMISHKSNSNSRKLQSESNHIACPDRRPSALVRGHQVDGEQAHISCSPQVVNAGVDTVHLSFDALICPDLLDRLDLVKRELQKTSTQKEVLFQFGQSELFTFSLQRAGSKFYPYVLRSGDVTLQISRRKQGSKIPNLALQIGSISCQSGVLEVLRTVKRWLKFHKCTIIDEIVSRIDIAVDLAAHISEFGLDDIDRHITRAVDYKPNYQHRKFTGVQFGRGDIVLRIYDKIVEMKRNRSLHKEEFFMKKWGSPFQDITRVEFQLRREALKGFMHGQRAQDLRAVTGRIRNIWAYLTEMWFRHTSTVVDRENKNQSKAIISQFWRSVQDGWKRIRKPLLRSRSQKHANIPDLIRQATGIMKTVVAGCGLAHDDLFGIMATVSKTMQDTIFEAYKSPDWKDDYLLRQTSSFVSF